MFNPGDIVFHRNLQRFGVVSPQILQKDCDSTSVCVDFDDDETMIVTVYFLEKIGQFR